MSSPDDVASDNDPSRAVAHAPSAPASGAMPAVAEAGPARARNESTSGVRTTPRSSMRRQAAPLAKIGMIIFAIGLIAIFADMVLFAAGTRNLPLWVNLTAMLAPVGLGLGLLGVVLENRGSSPALLARKAAAQK